MRALDAVPTRAKREKLRFGTILIDKRDNPLIDTNIKLSAGDQLVSNWLGIKLPIGLILV